MSTGSKPTDFITQSTFVSEPKTDVEIQLEINGVLESAQNLIAQYLLVDGQMKFGEERLGEYTEFIEFINDSVEIANTTIELLKADRLPEALALSRIQLERYLLLILWTQANKIEIKLNFQDSTKSEFDKYFSDSQNWLKELHNKQELLSLTSIEKGANSRKELVVKWDFSAVNPILETGLTVFFTLFPKDTRHKLETSSKGFRKKTTQPHFLDNLLEALDKMTLKVYKEVLTYDAIRENLKLNKIVNARSDLMIKAHYSFLSQFIHPTQTARRQIRTSQIKIGSERVVGSGNSYRKSSVLLGSLYALNLLLGILDEHNRYLDKVDKKFVLESGTSKLKVRILSAKDRTKYFNFIFNEPTPYEKFIYATGNQEFLTRQKIKHFADIPTKKLKPNGDILGEFENSLRAHVNLNVGKYESPF